MKELQKIIYKKDKDSINIGMELLVVKPLAQDQSNKETTKVVRTDSLCSWHPQKYVYWAPMITEQSSKRSKSNYPHNSSNQT